MKAWRRVAFPVLLVAAIMWAWQGLELSADRLYRSWHAAQIFAADLWPPDSSIWKQALQALQESIQMAVLGTVAGFLLSIPLAIVSTTTLVSGPVAVGGRLVAAAVRVLPSILLAFFLVIIVGFGPLAGALALSLYTMGFLAKLQYEALEGIPRDAMDAVRAMGANRFQVAWHVALPEAANAIRSQALFMFEYNVRASTVVGLVGAGGIGYDLSQYMAFNELPKVAFLLLVLYVTVVLIDLLSLAIRKRYLEGDLSHRPRWRDVFIGLRTGAAS